MVVKQIALTLLNANKYEVVTPEIKPLLEHLRRMEHEHYMSVNELDLTTIQMLYLIAPKDTELKKILNLYFEPCKSIYHVQDLYRAMIKIWDDIKLDNRTYEALITLLNNTKDYNDNNGDIYECIEIVSQVIKESIKKAGERSAK